MSDKGSKGQVLNLLVDYPDATYVKVGSIAGCSRQRVHQIAKSAGLTKKRKYPHYRSDITVDKVLELYHRDLWLQEIAPILGCSVHTVRSRLREAGISARESFSRSMRLNCRDDVTVERVLNLYHNDDLLIQEMAQTMGCNQATVKKRLREAGISKSECASTGARIRCRRKARQG